MSREGLQKNWSNFQLLVNEDSLEAFDPVPFNFFILQFAHSGKVHLLVASEHLETVAGCPVCRTVGTGRMQLVYRYTSFNTSAASLHVHTHIFLQSCS